MALYESTYILRADLAKADVEKISEAFNEVITSHDGKILKKELWGLRDLTYKIHKNKKGYYIHLGIEAENEAINELKRKYRLSEDVLRDLTIKVDKISNEPANLNEEEE